MSHATGAWAREVSGAARGALEASARRRRLEKKRVRKDSDGRVFLRGRVQQPWGTVWDVLHVHGPDKVELVAEGIPWEQEALGVASDVLDGRVRIAMGPARGVFKRAGAGLFLPTAEVRAPQHVKVRPMKPEDGETARVEVRRG